MKKILALVMAAIMCFGMVSTVFAAEMNFEDVQPDAWYYEDVKYAVENGLINGKTSSLFAPNSALTGAEAIKLAACMNQLYLEGEVSLKNGFPWYKPYEEYCLDNGIIQKVYVHEQPITRGDFVVIFANTLPEDAYEQINDIQYGEIPDVAEGDEYYEAAYKLYRAGILTGSGSARKLFPNNPIIRAEVAAIVTRMVNETSRVQFSFEKTEEVKTEEIKTEEIEEPAEKTDETKVEEEKKENATENQVYENVNVVIDNSEVIVEEGNMVFTDGTHKEDVNDDGNKGNIVYVEVTPEENIVDGTVVSGETVVNVLALQIKTQPKNFEIASVPARASFTLEIMGGIGPYKYQWELKKGALGAWSKMPEPDARQIKAGTAKYSGSTTNKLVFVVDAESVIGMKDYKFRCVVTDADGKTVTSEEVCFVTNAQALLNKKR